jgi:cystathionine beta-lyase/cystathionine gamma-synthase
MKIHSQAVHAGDRKREKGRPVPVTTPIYASASFFYDDAETLDKVFAHEQHGFAYARYDNPTNAALEEQIMVLEQGAGALACSSGMAALDIALRSTLLERRRNVVAATALYGATTNLLTKLMEPFGVDVSFCDICDPEALRAALEREKPGAVLVESISNPTLRVAPLDTIASLCRAAGASLIVDNTFASPLLLQPLTLGANIVVHSATKYLGGHGDVMGGLVIADAEHLPLLRQLSRTYGPTLGPFESYLTMRGIKTFPLRMERQCRNAAQLAAWLEQQPQVEFVHHPSLPNHPDQAATSRLFPAGLAGAMISFRLRGAGREQVFRFMNALRMIVPATSLGDVHTMVLYPVISSHRDLSPKQRERMGIHDNLVRLSTGIEAVEDLMEDLAQALAH